MSAEDFSSSPSSLSTFIQDPISNPNPNSSNPSKRKRTLRGTPDPDAEVIALSPRSLTAKNRFVCEICSKGFQRDQNLQLHRRGHNLPWKLKQRNKLEVVKKKVYICPEISCVHHDPVRALGDLTGVKKHYFRKHGEKKWKCEKCSKKYAVQSDWKAHSKICGTREYKCDCGTIFSRKDSFITHRAFCEALTQENSRMASFPMISNTSNLNFQQDLMTMNGGGGSGTRFQGMFGGGILESNLDANSTKPRLPIWLDRNVNDSHFENPNASSFSMPSTSNNNNAVMLQWLNRSQEVDKGGAQLNSFYNNYTTSTTTPPPPHMSATALLQKAAQMGSTRSTDPVDMNRFGLMSTTSLSNNNTNRFSVNAWHDSDFTRDFLGVGGNINERSTFNLQQSLLKFSTSSSSS